MISAYSFGWLDYSVVGAYLIGMLLVGVFFSKRQRSTHDYFKGGGRIPWWAAGISIFGTVLSAISFMAIPAKTFDSDWTYLLNALSPVFVAPIVIVLFLPFYHRLNVTSAYEYLENRFDLRIRLIGSVFFMLFQISRVSVVLLLPSIALNVVTGFSVINCILIMGLLSMIYTMLGGIEGVIWTDVVQVVILIGGVMLAIVFMILQLDQPLSSLYQNAVSAGKLKTIDWAFDLKEPTIWIALSGGIFSNLAFYGTDQTVVQRYVTSKNIESSKKSVWTNAILIFPSTILFFSLGTLLFLYYQSFPNQGVEGLVNKDAIFPYFIINELPQGVSGLLIAALFAAAMSSISSSLNSISTAYTFDFHQRFNWKGNGLVVARISTLVSGVICLGLAILLANLELNSLWDAFLKMVGLLTGSLGDLFALGMIHKGVTARAAFLGFIMSGLLQMGLFFLDEIHLLFYSVTGFVSAYMFGFFIQFLLPAENKTTPSD